MWCSCLTFSNDLKHPQSVFPQWALQGKKLSAIASAVNLVKMSIIIPEYVIRMFHIESVPLKMVK